MLKRKKKKKKRLHQRDLCRRFMSGKKTNNIGSIIALQVGTLQVLCHKNCCWSNKENGG